MNSIKSIYNTVIIIHVEEVIFNQWSYMTHMGLKLQLLIIGDKARIGTVVPKEIQKR